MDTIHSTNQNIGPKITYFYVSTGCPKMKSSDQMPHQYPDISEPVEYSVKVGQYLDYEVLKFLKLFTNLQDPMNHQPEQPTTS